MESSVKGMIAPRATRLTAFSTSTRLDIRRSVLPSCKRWTSSRRSSLSLNNRCRAVDSDAGGRLGRALGARVESLGRTPAVAARRSCAGPLYPARYRRLRGIPRRPVQMPMAIGSNAPWRRRGTPVNACSQTRFLCVFARASRNVRAKTGSILTRRDPCLGFPSGRFSYGLLRLSEEFPSRPCLHQNNGPWP